MTANPGTGSITGKAEKAASTRDQYL